MPFPFVVAESDISTVNVSVAHLQFSDQRAWVSSRSPKAGMNRHCRQAWQGAGCLFRTAGTLCRTFANPFLAVRPYLVWSSCEPKTFLPARVSAHSPYTGDAFPSTSPQSTSCSASPARKAAGGIAAYHSVLFGQFSCVDTEQAVQREQSITNNTRIIGTAI